MKKRIFALVLTVLFIVAAVPVARGSLVQNETPYGYVCMLLPRGKYNPDGLTYATAAVPHVHII